MSFAGAPPPHRRADHRCPGHPAPAFLAKPARDPAPGRVSMESMYPRCHGGRVVWRVVHGAAGAWFMGAAGALYMGAAAAWFIGAAGAWFMGAAGAWFMGAADAWCKTPETRL